VPTVRSIVSIGILRPREALTDAALMLCGLKMLHGNFESSSNNISGNWPLWFLCGNKQSGYRTTKFFRLLEIL
jgi:hypothetical protein